MKPAAVPLLLIALAVQAGRVTVQPGDAFRDSLLGLGAGDTLFFSPGTYSQPDNHPLLHVLPANDGVVITTDLLAPAVLDGQGFNRPVVYMQGPLGAATALENLVIRGGVSQGGEWFGGGGVFISSAQCVVKACTIEENQALVGGGVFVEGGSPVLTGLLIRNNHAMVSGGGASFYGSDVLLENSVIMGNTSEDDGGGVYSTLGDLRAVNTLFTGNSAGDDGGGIMQLRGRLLMEFSTVHDNYCFDDGGGILVSSADSLAMLSCIVTQNQGKGGIQKKQMGEALFFSHCNVWDNEVGNYVNMPDPTGTMGNISEDPIYADGLLRLSQPASGQTHLSPCVDAGHTTSYGSPVEWFSTRTDSVPDSGIADMGYHFNPYFYLGSPPEQGKLFDLSLFPCPTADVLFITVSSIYGAFVDIKAFDIAGRLVASLGSHPVSGEFQTVWNLPRSISPGVLFITCAGPQGVVIARTVVLR